MLTGCTSEQERASTESLNKKSFADRVHSAFNKTELLKNDAVLPDQILPKETETPPYFLNDDYGNMKKQIQD